jgi:gamma-glutamyltranspeptidase/glutathione hydrolase/leukotriene-C4 hydrolase
LRMIAEKGPDAFYTVRWFYIYSTGSKVHHVDKGPIADSIIRKIHATGGIMTRADLASYKPILKPALEGTYHGGISSSPRRIYTTHAPSSGPVVLFILNLLEGYNFIREGATPLNIHRLVESFKCGCICSMSYFDGSQISSWFCS